MVVAPVLAGPQYHPRPDPQAIRVYPELDGGKP
jgi:hypothetical protein